MNLVVQTTSGPDAWNASMELEVGGIVSYIGDHCRNEIESIGALDNCNGLEPDPCADDLCSAQASLCHALTLRELATSAAPVVLSDVFGVDALRVPPQDVESNVALEHAALLTARNAIGTAADALGSETGCVTDRLDDPVGLFESKSGDLLEQPVCEMLASTLVEALRVAEEAATSAARASIAVADRDRTAFTDLGRASRLSWFDTNLSRTAGVQVLVGGMREYSGGPSLLESGGYEQDPQSPAYQQLTQIGIGSQRPCRGQCGTARQLLRFSGAPFDQIVADPSSVSLDALISSHVRGRLAARYLNLDLDTMNTAQLAAHFDITPNAFAEARAWMRHEAAVLARPSGQLTTIPPLAIDHAGNPILSGATYDATTMASPTPPPSAHYLTAALAQTLWTGPLGAGPEKNYDPLTGESISPPLRAELAYLFDYAHAAARRVIREDRVDQRCKGILATLVQDALARGAARVEVCGVSRLNDPGDPGDDAEEIRVRAFGVPAADLLFVLGTTNLRCLVDGAIESEPCDIASTGATAPTPGILTGNEAGWTDFAEWNLELPSADLNAPPWRPSATSCGAVRTGTPRPAATRRSRGSPGTSTSRTRSGTAPPFRSTRLPTVSPRLTSPSRERARRHCSRSRSAAKPTRAPCRSRTRSSTTEIRTKTRGNITFESPRRRLSTRTRSGVTSSRAA